LDPVLVAKIAQIASVLEVSGYPKPGNVHRTQNFTDMVFEDFLISGIVIGDVMKKAANKGVGFII
jgi:triphosphoribosyl-dephospho-CoA synthase